MLPQPQSAHLTVALIQAPPVFFNLEQSLDKAERLTREAAAQGARLVVFPETWLPGYPVWLDFAPGAGLWDHPPAKHLFHILMQQSVRIGDSAFQKLRAMSDQAGVYLVMGAHERVGRSLYNTLFYFAPENKTPGGPTPSERPYEIHRKLMPTYTERLIWGRGDGSTLAVMPSPFGNIGGLICWEHWMPMARAAMHAKGEAVHVAQWPFVKELNLVASRHYAFEGGCFVLASGCHLRKKDVLAGFHSLNDPRQEGLALLEAMEEPPSGLLAGGSTVIAPDGQIVAGPHDSNDTLYAELDLNKIDESRLFLDTMGHYARPDVFRLLVDESPRENVVFQTGPIEGK